MKYIVCEKPGDFLLKEKPTPERKNGEALLKVTRVGICGTDLHAYLGNQAFFTYPRILGHELATHVLAIDTNEQGIKAGDKVVVMPYISCKNCIACKHGKTNCCTNIKVLGVHTDGGMQEQIVVPNDLLIPANNLTDDEMAIVEPLAIGAHAIRRADLKEGESVIVIGCGPIGIGILKQAQLLGAQTIALDVDEGRLQYAKEFIGVYHVVDVKDDPLLQIRDITNGDLASVVFDATGNKTALEKGPDYMAHGGRYVLVGLSKGNLIYHHPAIHAKEMTMMCSRNATLEDFKRVIEILPEFPTDKFITHTVHFSEMIHHFDSWTNPESGVIKATVEF
ncbi:zinc-binding alcohol dehydrogenase family protein [Zhouia amylolytica]|uniref:zinc-binding alcohol dehydrogenase family protein n=1 Tax=Zhouia amylolytica TaxID=376730 RepID=UPI0020CD261F|nr:zinc-binding alcohol dehydrogenase family protein [Zhouia amylolytica]MCQ0112765.1 zinc-binding alcohol dehydrogenase family protein [Zhouia amylolytica]